MTLKSVVISSGGDAIDVLVNATFQIETVLLTTVISLVYTLAIIIGLLGAIRVYKKWNRGDRNVESDVLGWGGSCVFLLASVEFVKQLML